MTRYFEGWRRWVLTVALLIVATIRGASLVTADPVLAVANNYDMIRVQGCIDAYPVRDATIPPASSSPEAPFDRYAFRDDVQPGCYWSSAMLPAWLMAPVLRVVASRSDDRAFSIRWMGVAGLLATLSLVVVFSVVWLRRGQTGAAAFNAAIAALLLMDPGNTLYLNGFYAEFWAVFWLYAVLAGTALVLTARERAPTIALAALACAAIALTMSKVQHAALGVLIAMIVAVVLWTARRLQWRVVLALLTGGVAGLALQVTHLKQPDMQSMAHANITNAVFFAFLATSVEPATTAARLGLPARCARYAGKSWFSPGMQDEHACPEVFSVSRVQLIALAWREPSLFVAVLREAMQRSRPFLPWLGVVEGERLGKLPAAHVSIGRPLAAMPALLYAALLLAPVPLLLGVLVAARRRPRDDEALLAVLACAALLPLAMLATIVLGDGFADTAKQSHLLVNLVLTFWIGFAGWLVARWRHARTSPRTLA